MTETVSLDWPQSSLSLLSQARQNSATCGELVKLIMTGTRRLDSWLIENRVIPALQEKDIHILRFSMAAHAPPPRAACLVPLPDGSAFACSTSERWSALEGHEAISAIQYIGFRYAADNEWIRGFEAFHQHSAETPAPIEPEQVAQIWQEVTGNRPHGFSRGVIDQIESFGLGLIGKAFNTQGRLGL